MEAARFGFDPSTPPAFKFDPTDADIVAHYLLPRALGIPDPPFAHAVVDDDPCSLPPQDLLEKHGYAGCHHAFFLDTRHTPDVSDSKNAGRRQRVVNGGAGGLWHGQKSTLGTVTLLRPGGGEVDIRYRRYDLTFFSGARADSRSAAPTGWVMRQYQIVSPPLHATVLSHIKMSAAKIKKDRLHAAAQHQQVPEQPEPKFEVFMSQEQPDPRFDPSTPSFKFEPTDGDIVAHYLLPRALGLPDPPFAHAVIDDEPGSLPPQDLFAKHGLAGSHQAFFLDTPKVSKNAGRMQRVVKGGAGGLWQGHKSTFGNVTLLYPGGGEEEIRYKRYDLTFFFSAARANGRGAAPTGWVMRQYQIVSPPLQATVLSHIKMSAAKIKKDRLQPAAAAAQHQQVLEQPDPRFNVFPVREQPDPRFNVFPVREQPDPRFDVFPVQEQPDPRFNVFPTQEHPDPGHHHPAMTGVPELAGPSHQVLPDQGQPGPSHHYPDLATMGGRSGQTDAPRGGMWEGDYSLYAGDGIAGDDDNNLWPRCDFRSFGGELEYSPLNVHDHDRGYFQTLLCI